MPEIVDYHLVTGDYSDVLYEVRNLIRDEGYRPLGGICVDDGFYVQAMVKYEEMVTPLDKKNMEK